MKTADPHVLPELREDLQIVAHPAGLEGGTYWQVHDPLQHRFFRISDDSKRILAVWQAGTTFEEFIAIAKDRIGIDLSPSRLSQFVHFLQTANLCTPTQDGAWGEMKSKRENGPSKLVRLFGLLISFRLPLINPESHLRRLRPWTDVVFTRGFNLLMLCVMLAGLYLSAFDMLAVLSNPFETFSLSGVLQIGIALIVLKTCYELGHAVTAHRFGCRVPTMGIAFMVFIPLLYTDVSDAWRLQSRKQRILISASGMIVEIYLAGIATFLWVFMNDGAARDITFYIATVGWISSLAFNLNPLAKFDGYYILSDFVGVANLQSKSTELAQWKLRQSLLFSSLQPPATYSRATAAALILFALLTWAYRLAIFLGIAYLLYGFAAKIVGMLLVFTTLLLFVVMPVWRELKVWRQLLSAHRSEASISRPMALAVVVLLSLLVPFSGTVHAPSVLLSSNLQKVFPPSDARVGAVHISQSSLVRKGDVLIDFEIPELKAEIATTRIQLDALRRQLGRAVSRREDRANLTVLHNEVLSLEQRQKDLAAEMEELRIVSRNDGRVVQVSEELQTGNWISRKRWVAVIRSGNELVARGYLQEADIGKISTGSIGVFVPDDPSRKAVPLAVSWVAPDAARLIELPELASAYGGPIETTGNELTPKHSVFPVEFRITADTEVPIRAFRGMVVLEGRSENLVTILWRRIAKVLVKEATF